LTEETDAVQLPKADDACFLTGATGWVGAAVAQELLDAGHQVIGLVRTADKAAALAATGAEVLEGTLDDPDKLRLGASSADAVIHTAYRGVDH
jgi:uncharacterized protein YbjT (DUF2867 family)